MKSDSPPLLTPPPDWAMFELDMPDGSGLSFLDATRDAGLPTQIIVSSGTDDAEVLASVARRRPPAFLPKPIDAALLPPELSAAAHFGRSVTCRIDRCK
jgi:DNA-binding NarL/FixJ family response regulator